MSDEEADLAEAHQERMCRLCEHYILGCSSMSYHFMCEGSRCEDALELLKDDLDEELRDLMNALKKTKLKSWKS